MTGILVCRWGHNYRDDIANLFCRLHHNVVRTSFSVESNFNGFICSMWNNGELHFRFAAINPIYNWFAECVSRVACPEPLWMSTMTVLHAMATDRHQFDAWKIADQNWPKGSESKNWEYIFAINRSWKWLNRKSSYKAHLVVSASICINVDAVHLKYKKL